MGLGERRAPSCSEDRALKTGSNSVKANTNYGRSEGGVRPKAGVARSGLILLSIGTF